MSLLTIDFLQEHFATLSDDEVLQKRAVLLIARGPLRTNADGASSVIIDAADAFRLPEGSF